MIGATNSAAAAITASEREPPNSALYESGSGLAP